MKTAALAGAIPMVYGDTIPRAAEAAGPRADAHPLREVYFCFPAG